MNQDILLHMSTEVCFYIRVSKAIHHILQDHHMSVVWLSTKGQVKNITQKISSVLMHYLAEKWGEFSLSSFSLSQTFNFTTSGDTWFLLDRKGRNPTNLNSNCVVE